MNNHSSFVVAQDARTIKIMMKEAFRFEIVASVSALLPKPSQSPVGDDRNHKSSVGASATR